VIGPQLRLFLKVVAWLCFAWAFFRLAEGLFILVQGGLMDPFTFVAHATHQFVSSAGVGGILLALLSIDQRLEQRR
jgi:hypothetical protein